MTATPETPTPPTDVPTGSRWAYRASYRPAAVATVAGIVTIQAGTYGRFLLTEAGWVRDDAA